MRMDWSDANISSRVGIGLAPGTTVPRTTTDCANDAIVIFALTMMDDSVASETCCMNASKPVFSTVTKYRSGFRFLATKLPSAPVVTRTTAPDVRLLMETLALGIAAPRSEEHTSELQSQSN